MTPWAFGQTVTQKGVLETTSSHPVGRNEIVVLPSRQSYQGRPASNEQVVMRSCRPLASRSEVFLP